MLPSSDKFLQTLRPLPKPVRGIACGTCSKPQASWCSDLPVGDEDLQYLCSLCILYKTSWGQKERSHVEEVLLEVQKSIGSEFPKTPNNQLQNTVDGDRILGIMVLASRVARVHKMADGWSK